MFTDPNKAMLETPEVMTDEQPVSDHPGADKAWYAPWSFRWVMVRFHRLVYRVAFNVLADSAEAEDVCQEVFSRYWTHQENVQEPKQWLLRVARNESISRLRKRARCVYSDQPLEPDAEGSSIHSEQPEAHWQQIDDAQQLRQAINALPEPQRSLVILFDLEDQDGATCAEVLNLSTTQVKVYLHRARKRLRQQLEHAL